jgi:hypothetical protein
MAQASGGVGGLGGANPVLALVVLALIVVAAVFWFVNN